MRWWRQGRAEFRVPFLTSHFCMKFITNLPRDSVRKASDMRLMTVVGGIKFEGRESKLHLILYQAYFVDRERRRRRKSRKGNRKKGTKKIFGFYCLSQTFFFVYTRLVNNSACFSSLTRQTLFEFDNKVKTALNMITW